MIKTLLSVTICFLTLLGNAQSWYKQGTKLSYTYRSFGLFGVNEYTAEKDTSLQNQPCTKFTGRSIKAVSNYTPGQVPYDEIYDTVAIEPFYLYHLNDACYFFKESSFQKIYDFNSPINATWPIYSKENCIVFYARVVSKNDTLIAGKMRRGIHVLYSPDENESNGESIYIIEGIGATSYAFFPPPVCIIYEEIQQLKCFQNEIEFINFSQDTTCELRIKTGLNSISQAAFNIYPNPTKQILNIDGPEDYSLTIYNQLGKSVIQKDLLSKHVTLDLAQFENGIYILSIKSKEAEYWQKVIVSH